MSNEATQMVQSEHLPIKLQQHFDGILDALANLRVLEQDEAVNAWSTWLTRMQRGITEYPVLAKTLWRYPQGADQFSLLHFVLVLERAVVLLDTEPAIKLLIEANPHVLLLSEHTLLRQLAMGRHCTLMPWIAKHFAWVLDDCASLAHSPLLPHFLMFFAYRHGQCDTSTIQAFYNEYPQGLGQCSSRGPNGSSMLPVHSLLVGDNPDLDLLKWMIRKYPDSLLHDTAGGRGNIALDFACQHLPSRPSMVKICCFLASECPESLRATSSRATPLYTLAPDSNRAHVQKVILHFLRECPDSVIDLDMSFRGLRPTRPCSFIKRVSALLKEEPTLVREIDWCIDASTKFMEKTESYAAASIEASDDNDKSSSSVPPPFKKRRLMEEAPSPTTPTCELSSLKDFTRWEPETSLKLFSATSVVFNDWATSCVDAMKQRLEEIPDLIAQTCVEFQQQG